MESDSVPKTVQEGPLGMRLFPANITGKRAQFSRKLNNKKRLHEPTLLLYPLLHVTQLAVRKCWHGLASIAKHRYEGCFSPSQLWPLLRSKPARVYRGETKGWFCELADPLQRPEMGNLGNTFFGTQKRTFEGPSWRHLNNLLGKFNLPSPS